MPEKIKVLIVEDNDDEREFMKEGFNLSGLYEVVAEAENGDKLLEIVQKPSFSLPQVIVSDLNMPGKNGYDVIQEIKNNSLLHDISVIILSSAPFVPYGERCKELGACAFYTKPDTFLEYASFAQDIYGKVQECIHN